MQLLSKKDLGFGAVIGFLIGVFFLPILKSGWPDIYRIVSFAVIPFFFLGALAGLLVSKILSSKLPVIWQIAKFGLIGVLNSFVDLGVLSGLSVMARSIFATSASDILLAAGSFTVTFYVLFKTLSFVVANVNSYAWNRYWTFDTGVKKLGRAGFLQFFAVSLIGLLVNVIVSASVFQLGVTTTGLTGDQWGLLSALAGIFAGLAWNFVGYKFVVFKS